MPFLGDVGPACVVFTDEDGVELWRTMMGQWPVMDDLVTLPGNGVTYKVEQCRVTFEQYREREGKKLCYPRVFVKLSEQ